MYERLQDSLQIGSMANEAPRIQVMVRSKGRFGITGVLPAVRPAGQDKTVDKVTRKVRIRCTSKLSPVHTSAARSNPAADSTCKSLHYTQVKCARGNVQSTLLLCNIPKQPQTNGTI